MNGGRNRIGTLSAPAGDGSATAEGVACCDEVAAAVGLALPGRSCPDTDPASPIARMVAANATTAVMRAIARFLPIVSTLVLADSAVNQPLGS